MDRNGQAQYQALSSRPMNRTIPAQQTGDRRHHPAVTAAGVRRVIDQIRVRLPATRILLLGIFPRGARPR